MFLINVKNISTNLNDIIVGRRAIYFNDCSRKRRRHFKSSIHVFKEHPVTVYVLIHV